MNANRFYPHRLDAHAFARNGFVPQGSFASLLASGVNHVESYRRKTFYSRGDGTSATVGGRALTNTLARFRCHTGYGATHISVHLGLGLSDNAAAVAPRVDVNCTIAGGATTTVSTFYGLNESGVTTDAPDEIAYRTIRVPVAAATTYEVSIDVVDFARVLTICAYEEASSEIDTSVNYYVDQSEGAVGFPIIDTTRQGILRALSKIWRRNGPQLLTWPGEVTAPTNATTTWKNVIDNSTAVASSSAGWYLGDGDETFELLCRLSDAKAIDVVLAAHLSCTGSATGEVRLQDGSRTLCSLTGAGTASAWYTTTTTISAVDTLAKCDLQFRTSNAANTVSCHAVSVYAYLA